MANNLRQKLSLILMLSSTLLYSQDDTVKTRHSVAVGTNWFPAYLFVSTPNIDNYGVIAGYEYSINKLLNTRVGILYNTRIVHLNKDPLPNQDFLIGCNAGLKINLFRFHRFNFSSGFDVVYTRSVNSTYRNVTYQATEERLVAGPFLSIDYSFSNFFSVRSESSPTYGSRKLVARENDIVTQVYKNWGWYSYKVISLELVFKF